MGIALADTDSIAQHRGTWSNLANHVCGSHIQEVKVDQELATIVLFQWAGSLLKKDCNGFRWRWRYAEQET